MVDRILSVVRYARLCFHNSFIEFTKHASILFVTRVSKLLISTKLNYSQVPSLRGNTAPVPCAS